MGDDIVAAGHLGGKTLEAIYVDINAKLSSSDVTTTATANKVLRLDAQAKMPWSVLSSVPTEFIH